MYKGIGARWRKWQAFGKWQIFLGIVGVCFLASNVLMATPTLVPVTPGQITSNDTGDKAIVFQFLNTASPELISFLQRIGVLTENTNTQKTLTTWVNIRDEAILPQGIISADLRYVIGNTNNVWCAVFLLGADFASWEHDVNTEGLHVRTLPFGLIKCNSIPNGWMVGFQKSMKSSFKLLIYVPGGQNSILHIVNYGPVQVAGNQSFTSSNSQFTFPQASSFSLMDTTQAKAALTVFFKNIITAVELGAMVLDPNTISQTVNVPNPVTGTMESQSRAVQGKEKEFLIFNFLNNPNEEFVPLARQVGLLSEAGSKKTLTAPLSLKRYFHYQLGFVFGTDITKEIKIVGTQNKSFAIKFLDGIPFAPGESDDAPNAGGLLVRALPGGWLLRQPSQDPKVRVMKPSWLETRGVESYRFALFFPGNSPRWEVQEHIHLSPKMTSIAKACLEFQDNGAFKEQCRQALVEDLASGRMLSVESMRHRLSLLAINTRNAGHPEPKSSIEGCPDWQQLRFLLRNCNGYLPMTDYSLWLKLARDLAAIESTGHYLYYFISNNASWYSPNSALGRALFLSEQLPVASIWELRLAYICLAIKYQKSPEWIHCVLTLYLSMHPYRVLEFLENLKRSGGTHVFQFFERYCASVLAQYPVETMSRELMQLFFDKQRNELNLWRGAQGNQNTRGPNTFANDAAKAWNLKNALPDLDAIFQQHLSNAVTQQDKTSLQEMITVTKEMFQWDRYKDGQNWVANTPSSHVMWPYCLWKSLSIDTPLDVIQQYKPNQPMTLDQVKGAIMNTWVTGGLLDNVSLHGDLSHDTNGGAPETIAPNATARERATIACRRILQRFTDLRDNGLKLMYGLGEFLKAAKTDPNGHAWRLVQQATGDQRLQGTGEQNLQATGARSFQEFLNGPAWGRFIGQTVCRSILENRSSGGVYDAFEMELPRIVRAPLPNISNIFLWTELALQRYRAAFLCIFGSNTANTPDEKEQGMSRFYYKIYPIFNVLPWNKPTYAQTDYDVGRHPIFDCLVPFKTGQFLSANRNDQYGQRWLSGNNVKNTSDVSSGDYKFTYIEPFSPVRVFYEEGRDLFKQMIAPKGGEIPMSWDMGAFNDILKLALSYEPVRKEYLSVIAGFPHEPVSPDQWKRWNLQQNGFPISFHAISYTGAWGQNTINRLNGHLQWWKIDPRGFFYPSFELWKYLAVDLGYARWKDDQNHDTDLVNLPQPKPLMPVFDSARNWPTPVGNGNFYKHVNIYGQRIDINPAAQFDQTQPLSSASITSPNNPRNQGNPVQSPEPQVFQAPLSFQNIAPHADWMQQMFWKICYPEQITCEDISKVLVELNKWLSIYTQLSGQPFQNRNFQQIKKLQELYGTPEYLQYVIGYFQGWKFPQAQGQGQQPSQPVVQVLFSPPPVAQGHSFLTLLATPPQASPQGQYPTTNTPLPQGPQQQSQQPNNVPSNQQPGGITPPQQNLQQYQQHPVNQPQQSSQQFPQLQPLNQNQKELEKKIIIISQRLKTASDDLDEWNRLPPYPRRTQKEKEVGYRFAGKYVSREKLKKMILQLQSLLPQQVHLQQPRRLTDEQLLQEHKFSIMGQSLEEWKNINTRRESMFTEEQARAQQRINALQRQYGSLQNLQQQYQQQQSSIMRPFGEVSSALGEWKDINTRYGSMSTEEQARAQQRINALQGQYGSLQNLQEQYQYFYFQHMDFQRQIEAYWLSHPSPSQ